MPYGSFRDVLLTKDFTPLDPKILEYTRMSETSARSSVLGVSGGSGREKLLGLTRR